MEVMCRLVDMIDFVSAVFGNVDNRFGVSDIFTDQLFNFCGQIEPRCHCDLFVKQDWKANTTVKGIGGTIEAALTLISADQRYEELYLGFCIAWCLVKVVIKGKEHSQKEWILLKNCDR